jgi:hypothetical protein
MKFRLPEIVLGALLTVALFAVGLLFSSQHPRQGIGIDSKQRTGEIVQSYSDAEHTPTREIKPATEPQQSGGHADNYEIYGVKPGELLLFLATVGLWYATMRLVRDARHTAERQLRAYVFVESVELITESRIVRAVLSIKNSGQTPAYDLVVYVGISSRGAGEIFVPPEPDDVSLDKLSVGPGMSISTSNQFEVPATNNELLRAFDNGLAVVYIYGRIDYIDAFNVPRYLIYRMRAAKLSNGSWHLAATPDGNKAN